MIWALLAACVVATIPAGLRWLRVAQREHYLPPSVASFAGRWWTTGPANLLLLAAMIAGLVGSWWSPWWGLLVPAAQVGPIGLGVRGRTSSLAWTKRLRRVCYLSGLLVAAVLALGVVAGSAFVVCLGVFLLPALVDLALLALGPIEHRMGDRWVEQASRRLAASGARVVAITGSYGKTTTKQYTAHLLGGSMRVVASPASFNNRMGLARAINEHLVPGTDVFVAEMGTYGPGEIAELCSWLTPEVSAMVAVGPVHLERFGSEEKIVAAKSEILDRARHGVIAVDHPLLAALAGERAESLDVITVSAGGAPARVQTGGGALQVDGEQVASIPGSVLALNLGVAVGIGIALGVPLATMVERIPGLTRPEHRLSVSRSESGITVVDDTYNSNPAGAILALATLAAQGGNGRKVVVTPGMVELGGEQGARNEELARSAAAVADDLVVVGRTNRTALLTGARGGRAKVTVVSSRDEAVGWVRKHLAAGDTVLYENDLPDHYP